jgi:hypothetical protein
MKARVSLNLPQSLKKAAEEFAEKDGVSLNQYPCSDRTPSSPSRAAFIACAAAWLAASVV